MAAVWYRARAELRQHWPGAVVLVLILGIAAGVVMASAAGARRTSSAYPRMLEASNAPELLLSPNGDGTLLKGFHEDVAALPTVAEVGPTIGLAVGFDPDSEHGHIETAGANGAVDARMGYTVDRPKLLAGRLPDPHRTDEVLINRFLAAQGVEVGERVDLVIVDSELFDGAPAEEWDGIPVRATVVGIGVLPSEVVAFTDLGGFPFFMVGPAFTEMVPPNSHMYEGLAIDAHPGTDLEQLRSDLEDLAEEHAEALDDQTPFISNETEHAGTVQDSIRPLAVSLAAFAAVVGLVAVVIVAQALRRHLLAATAERASLLAIGVASRGRMLVRLVRCLLIGAVAAVVGVGIALGGSSRFPIGPARIAEPEPGIAVDLPVLVIGVVAVVLLAVVVALPERRRARDAGGGSRRSVLVATLAAWPALATGSRAAVSRASGAGGPGIVAGAVVGVVAVLAATTFGASLDDLVERPARYGQTWDRLVDAQFSPVLADLLMDTYEDDERIRALAAGTHGELTIGGERVAAISWTPLAGSVEPLVVEGEAADEPGEVALGGKVLERHGLRLGDLIRADGGHGPTDLTVVGEVVFPRFGLGSFAATGLGRGAQLHHDDLFAPGLPTELPPGVELPPGMEHEGQLYNFMAIDAEGDLASLDDELHALSEDQFMFVREAQRPTTISDLTRVRPVPVLLAGALALLAAATLAHGLITSIRTRRRELAVLKSLGFSRRQVSMTVYWHALTVVALALVTGIPLGVAAGRTMWTTFAHGVYVPAHPIVPLAAMGAVIAGALALGALIATVPARQAINISPAAALRAE